MRIALYQYDIASNDPEANSQKIVLAAQTAAADGAELLVLPEVCLTGFGAGKNAAVSEESSPWIERIAAAAKQHKLRILAGLRFRHGDDAVRNSAVLFGEGGIEQIYSKRILFRYWQEHHWVAPGKEGLSFELGSWQISPVICYELRFPEVFLEHAGNQLFLVIANWPKSRREHWLTLLKARAIESQAYVVGVNRVGSARGVDFSGDSVVYGPAGETVLELGDAECCLSVDLDLAALERYRREFPVLTDRQAPGT